MAWIGAVFHLQMLMYSNELTANNINMVDLNISAIHPPIPDVRGVCKNSYLGAQMFLMVTLFLLSEVKHDSLNVAVCNL